MQEGTSPLALQAPMPFIRGQCSDIDRMVEAPASGGTPRQAMVATRMPEPRDITSITTTNIPFGLVENVSERPISSSLPRLTPAEGTLGMPRAATSRFAAVAGSESSIAAPSVFDHRVQRVLQEHAKRARSMSATLVNLSTTGKPVLTVLSGKRSAPAPTALASIGVAPIAGTQHVVSDASEDVEALVHLSENRQSREPPQGESPTTPDPSRTLSKRRDLDADRVFMSAGSLNSAGQKQAPARSRSLRRLFGGLGNARDGARPRSSSLSAGALVPEAHYPARLTIADAGDDMLYARSPALLAAEDIDAMLAVIGDSDDSSPRPETVGDVGQLLSSGDRLTEMPIGQQRKTSEFTSLVGDRKGANTTEAGHGQERYAAPQPGRRRAASTSSALAPSKSRVMGVAIARDEGWETSHVLPSTVRPLGEGADIDEVMAAAVAAEKQAAESQSQARSDIDQMLNNNPSGKAEEEHLILGTPHAKARRDIDKLMASADVLARYPPAVGIHHDISQTRGPGVPVLRQLSVSSRRGPSGSEEPGSEVLVLPPVSAAFSATTPVAEASAPPSRSGSSQSSLALGALFGSGVLAWGGSAAGRRRSSISTPDSPASPQAEPVRQRRKSSLAQIISNWSIATGSRRSSVQSAAADNAGPRTWAAPLATSTQPPQPAAQATGPTVLPVGEPTVLDGDLDGLVGWSDRAYATVLNRCTPRVLSPDEAVADALLAGNAIDLNSLPPNSVVSVSNGRSTLLVPAASDASAAPGGPRGSTSAASMGREQQIAESLSRDIDQVVSRQAPRT